MLLEMLLSSPIYLVCCSHHGSPSNLLHISDGFIEVPVKSIKENYHMRDNAVRISYGQKFGFIICEERL